LPVDALAAVMYGPMDLLEIDGLLNGDGFGFEHEGHGAYRV
jgi:hypothetical protein